MFLGTWISCRAMCSKIFVAQCKTAVTFVLENSVAVALRSARKKVSGKYEYHKAIDYLHVFVELTLLRQSHSQFRDRWNEKNMSRRKCKALFTLNCFFKQDYVFLVWSYHKAIDYFLLFVELTLFRQSHNQFRDRWNENLSRRKYNTLFALNCF